MKLGVFTYILNRKFNEMLQNFILHIEVFLFVMSWLVVLANTWNIVAVFRLKSGKVFSSRYDLVTLGACISYIITMLSIGF